MSIPLALPIAQRINQSAALRQGISMRALQQQRSAMLSRMGVRVVPLAEMGGGEKAKEKKDNEDRHLPKM